MAEFIYQTEVSDGGALFEPSELLAVLQEYAEAVKAGYAQNLAESGHHASGNLMSTISTEVEVDGHYYVVSLNLQDYWKYVEEDTRPHWPPPDAILKWIAIKGIIPRPDEKGHIPTPKQLAFLIGRKISEDGTTGTHDLQRAQASLADKWESRIAEALGRDALTYIMKLL